MSSWQAQVFELLNQFYVVPRKILDEGDFIRATLKFANEGTLRPLAMQVSGIPLPAGALQDPAWQRKADSVAMTYRAEHDQLIDDLDRVIAGNVDTKFVGRLNAQARVLPVPQFKGNTVGFHYVVRDLFAANAYAIKLFLDPAKPSPKKPYGKDLHRCQWEKCKRFFLSSDLRKQKEMATGRKGGIDRTEFCSDPCMKSKRDSRRYPPPTPKAS